MTAPPAAPPDLVPVRALNQVTYCPRLYYLQYVDCVMPTNEHVEGGLFDHRRVDDPDLKGRTRADGDAARTRAARSCRKSRCTRPGRCAWSGTCRSSTRPLQTLVENDIGVVYLTGYGKFIAAVTPAPHKNVGLREAQYRAFADPAVGLTLAKAAVRAKLANQRAYLMRNLRSDDARGSEEVAAKGIAGYSGCSTTRPTRTPCSASKARGRPSTSASSGGS